MNIEPTPDAYRPDMDDPDEWPGLLEDNSGQND